MFVLLQDFVRNAISYFHRKKLVTLVLEAGKKQRFSKKLFSENKN